MLAADPDVGTFVGLQISIAAAGLCLWVAGFEHLYLLAAVVGLLSTWRYVRAVRYLKLRELDAWMARQLEQGRLPLPPPRCRACDDGMVWQAVRPPGPQEPYYSHAACEACHGLGVVLAL